MFTKINKPALAPTYMHRNLSNGILRKVCPVLSYLERNPN